MSSLAVTTIKSITGNDAITISESGVPQLEVPAFRVLRTTNQALTSGVSSIVQFDTTAFDTNSRWDAANYRFTPQIAGYYWLSTILHLSVTSNTRRICTISCTGDADIRAFDDNINASINIRTGGGIAYFNGCEL